MALCKKPFKQGVWEFGCGQCMPCRIRRRKLWAHRMMLESLVHGDSCFVTLTTKFVCFGGTHERTATLDPKVTQNWLKRLRKEIFPRKVRYFLCGEYGEKSERPHYHAAMFGLSRFDSKIIERTWGIGHVYVGDITEASANYIAGYVTKKMTSKDDSRLYGRFPEFARMSRRPGIGALAVPGITEALCTVGGAQSIAQNGDVPQSVNFGGKSMPLGRYLRSKIREVYGFEETNVPKEILRKMSEEMRELHEAEWLLAAEKGESTKEFYQKKIATKNQKILNIEAKSKLYTKRKVL